MTVSFERRYVRMNPQPLPSNGPIGIVAALREEISELLPLLSEARCVRIGSRDFWTGNLDGRDVVVVLSRVGKVAAASTTVALIRAPLPMAMRATLCSATAYTSGVTRYSATRPSSSRSMRGSSSVNGT